MLNTGDIAFVGFNTDGNDDVAFVALAAIDAGQAIHFNDNEWLGSAFNTGESGFTWTASAAIAAGTIVTISNISTTISSNLGSVAFFDTSNKGLSATSEILYAYIGGTLAPTTFLTAATNGASGLTSDGASTANTGLVAGVNALALASSTDIGAFTGARGGATSFADYRAAINNPANWVVQAAAGDQNSDGIAPDVPFSTTAFTINVTPTPSLTVNDVTLAEGHAGTTAFTFTVSLSAAASGPVTVDYATQDGTASAASDYAAVAGTLTFAEGETSKTVTVQVNGDTSVEANETFSLVLANASGATIADGTGLGTITNDDIAITAIHDIQGASHTSPLVGQTVTTLGIVTAVDTNGFYLQAKDLDADANVATSEAVFVFTGSAPTVHAGDEARVTGTVSEFIPGGAASNNLTQTELTSPVIAVLSTGNALPTAIVLGLGGRTAPTEVIDNDHFATFDPAQDGIDFYESLEGMRVTVPTPLVVGATNSFGEIFTVADNGATATGLNDRGVVVARGSVGDGLAVTNTGAGSDFNPERIQIDADSFTPGTIPAVNVGTKLNDVTGVLSYSFGNFEVLATEAVTVSASPNAVLTRETTLLHSDGTHMTIAQYNVENLDPGDGAVKFSNIATQIVANLGAPDVIALQEVQDNNGPTNDSVVAANATLQMLVDAISAAGGPTYTWIDNPFVVDDQVGGEPGGNIRVAYLYNAAHVSLVGAVSTTPNALADFAGSRVPLVATFAFTATGDEVTLINNHFTSKGGSSPLFGSQQESLNGGADARLVQATNVANYVTSLDPAHKVVVLGDLNEFTNEESLAPLNGAGLSAMSLTLAEGERYSYVFEGNGQELDQTYVRANVAAIATLDIVHVNAEFADQISDHDPAVLSLDFTPVVLPTVAVSNASVTEGDRGTRVLSFTVSLDTASAQTVTVNYATADGTATAGSDYLADAGLLTFAPGETSKTVDIVVRGDFLSETDETLALALSGATNAVVGASGTGTIVNDDTVLKADVDLSNYVRIGRYDLPEPTRTAHPADNLLAQEVSAVTYNQDTDTLFVLGDGGTAIVQVTKTGQLIDTMTLSPGGSPQGTEFYDPEGLTYIGNGEFVMTEERDRNLVKFTYVPDTVLDRAHAQTVDLGTFVPNIGLEGVSYDPQTGGYIVVKEVSPEGIFQTDVDFAAGTATNGSPTTINSVDLFNPALVGTADFADVFALSNIDDLAGTAEGGHLLVLSQESGRIVEVDRAGNVYSSLTIRTDSGNPLSVANQQHEGLAMDDQGYLYVVSENGGGDADHPQLWVYAPSLAPNAAPTGLVLSNQVNAILENTGTSVRIKVADVTAIDDDLGNNAFSVTGADAASFEVDSTGLYIKAGTVLDFETKSAYHVTVNVDDNAVGGTPDASANFDLAVTDVVNEGATTTGTVYISEVAPWSSGNSPIAADWFEVTNGTSATVSLSGWKMDDNSHTFSSAVALNGVTSLAPGESAIFIETASAATVSAFKTLWFGANAPARIQIGTYSGSGVGLSTGGDEVNLYDAAGVKQAGVAFGASPTGTFATFDNSAGLTSTGAQAAPTISTLSAAGLNGAFVASGDANEVGSPGAVINNVAPVITSNGGGASTLIQIDENTSTVTAVTATDENFLSDVRYSIAGGADAALFQIDALLGGLSFRTAPDFEHPTDAGQNNFYDVIVRASDGVLSDTQAISVKVNNANEAPALTGAQAVLAHGTEDVAYTVSAADLLAGYTDADGDALSVASLSASSGSVVDNGDGTWTITQAADFNGAVTLSYQVTDGSLPVAATLGYTIDAVNDAPTGSPTAVLADGTEDVAYTVSTADLVAGFSDVDGDTLSVANLTASSGSVVDNGNGTFTVTQAANFNGAVTLSYDVTDGTASVPATLGYTIAAVNDAPALTGAQAVLAHGTEDVAYTVSAASLLAGFTDVEGDALSVANVSASRGTVADNGDGTWTITQAANANGAVTLSYSVTDGSASTAATLGYTIDAVNDAPTAIALSNSTIAENSANGTTVGTLSTTDVDNTTGFTYALLDSAGGRFFLNNGAIKVGSGSLLDYETATSHTITVKVTDAGGLSYTQNLTINLSNVVENQTWNGTTAGDTFTAPSADNWTANGKAGNDTITTLGGNDIIFAAGGNDTVSTGAGNDTIYFTGSGGGFDSVDGGTGTDTIKVNANNTVIGLSSFTGIEAFDATGFTGAKVMGTANADVFTFTGVTLTAITEINGGAGDDTIVGSAGADTIVGGAGIDQLSGGAGADTFVYKTVAESSAAKFDHILDFVSGLDKIDLSAIDANGSLTGNQAFTFIGTAEFNGYGQVRVGTVDGHAVLSANVSGNLAPDFIIYLDNTATVVAGDLVL